MLEIVKYNEDNYEFPCLLVLGCFDGLHIGHAELLKKAKLQAKINGLDLGVMMFTEGKGGKQVFTFEERLSFLEKYNVKFVLKVDFNDAFKKTAPLDFLQILEETLNVKAYMSGKDFRFGEGAKGKSSTLKNYAEDEDNGVWYMPVKDVTYGDKKVSTTLVKTLIEEGDIQTVNELLGRNFSVTGTVTEGADRGSKVLGFPTLNIRYPENKVELKHGVYAVKCVIGEKQYSGIANFGPRPTFDEKDAILEAHLENFDENLYGTDVTIEFTKYLRETRKFDSAEALKQQLIFDLQNKDGEAVPVETAEPAEAIQENIAENTITEEIPAIEEMAVTDDSEPTAEEAPAQDVQPVTEVEIAENENTPAEEAPEQPEVEVTEEASDVTSDNAEAPNLNDIFAPDDEFEKELEEEYQEALEELNELKAEYSEFFEEPAENAEVTDDTNVEIAEEPAEQTEEISEEYSDENYEPAEEPQETSEEPECAEEPAETEEVTDDTNVEIAEEPAETEENID